MARTDYVINNKTKLAYWYSIERGKKDQQHQQRAVISPSLMAGTRRSTRSAPSTSQAPAPMNLRSRGSSRLGTREESDKENTPPKHTNTQTTGKF